MVDLAFTAGIVLLVSQTQGWARIAASLILAGWIKAKTGTVLEEEIVAIRGLGLQQSTTRGIRITLPRFATPVSSNPSCASTASSRGRDETDETQKTYKPHEPHETTQGTPPTRNNTRHTSQHDKHKNTSQQQSHEAAQARRVGGRPNGCNLPTPPPPPSTSTSTFTLTLSTTTSFIPLSSIGDVIINEAVYGWKIIYYLAVVTWESPAQGGGAQTQAGASEAKLVVGFPELLPRLAEVRAVWQGVRATLFDELDEDESGAEGGSEDEV